MHAATRDYRTTDRLLSQTAVATCKQLRESNAARGAALCNAVAKVRTAQSCGLRDACLTAPSRCQTLPDGLPERLLSAQLQHVRLDWTCDVS